MGLKPIKRKRANQPEEITFDFAARQEYLTGFHKRKLQRTKHAKEAVARREREERIKERKLLREERRAELEQHVKTVNSLVERDEDQTDGENEDDGSQSEDWQGFAEPVIVDHEDKFVDDDRYTTVTVEAVDVTREGLERVRSESEDACAAVEDGLGERGKEKTSETRAQDQAQGASVAKRKWSKENSNKSRMGHRKFRYESKGQRKLSRLKQAAANRAQAKKRKGQA